MCGIVGYVGPRPALEILLAGLARLEYRGYDSAGVAVLNQNSVSVVRQAGRIAELETTLKKSTFDGGNTGIGHTRWATHGAPNTMNAHPHSDCGGNVIVVHNGIIENWADLKEELIGRRHEFTSETDTEVVAHLIEEMADVDLAEAVRRVMNRAEGSMALAVMRSDQPDLVVA
ncbi:MAG TPA: glutamine--fructose-6-phosphate aminotransferase, partial [Acidimicrobiia bacterium]|nr:glutamine--fructose-6-phosphate aminotransferase [Acidimicrobiia bacterium]